MDLQLVKSGFDFGRKKKKWVFLLAALGFTGYGAYRVYNLPSVANKRRKILKLLAALLSIAEAVSDSAESIGIVSKDLREFLQSDSDQIPNSLKQLSKIAMSDELSTSLVKLTQCLTMGVLRGCQSENEKGHEKPNSGFSEKVLERVFSAEGSGFASVVVGSFARNLVSSLYSVTSQNHAIGEPNSNPKNASGSDQFPQWTNIVFSEESRDMIGQCVQVFVTTAVTVYLDKTRGVNTYDELFAGLTNPEHETKVKDMFAFISNNAVETLVRTSHRVLTEESKAMPSPEMDGFDQGGSESDSEGNSEWVISKVSSTLAVPSNRRLVLDVTGRVTFETVRSLLEFVLEKLYEGARGLAKAGYEAVLGVVRYSAAKSSLIATICLSLCLRASGSSAWLLMPA